jgi:hypothetical protein
MVETVRLRQVVWFVMLKSGKDRVIGVDTPGQQVPPCVQYGTTCLLIRDVVGSVPCRNVYNCHDSRAYGYKRFGILF